MAHCMICRKDFASSASLRTHRSRYHRISDTEMVPAENQETDQTNSLETNQTSSQDTNQTNSQETNQTNSQETDQTDSQNMDSQDTIDEDDALSGKREHEDSDTYKNRHVYKELSGIHEILKNILKDTKKELNFLTCYNIKHWLHKLVPEIFDSEFTMQEKLNQEQFQYVKNDERTSESCRYSCSFK